MDKIIIKEAKFSCNIGVAKKERGKKQEIFIDAEIFFNAKKPGKTDKIGDTLNYSEIYDLMKKTAEDKEYKLIEAMAENIAEEILGSFSVNSALVRVKKPSALADRNVKYAAVEIMRGKKLSTSF